MKSILYTQEPSIVPPWNFIDIVQLAERIIFRACPYKIFLHTMEA